MTPIVSNCVNSRSTAQIMGSCTTHFHNPMSHWLHWEHWKGKGSTGQWLREVALLHVVLVVVCQIGTVLPQAPETQILSICSHIFQSWTKVHWDQWSIHTGNHEFWIQFPEMKVLGTGRKLSTRKSVSNTLFYGRCFGNDYVLCKEIGSSEFIQDNSEWTQSSLYCSGGAKIFNAHRN